MQHVLHLTLTAQPKLTFLMQENIFAIIYKKVNNFKPTCVAKCILKCLTKLRQFYFSNVTYRYSDLRQMQEQNADREEENDSDEVSMYGTLK